MGGKFLLCANFINQNSFYDIWENTPESYGMGLSSPPYGKSPQFCDFFALRASLNVDKLVYDKRKRFDVERSSGLVIAQD